MSTIPYSTKRPIGTRNLTDVQDSQATANQILKYNGTTSQYEPSSDTLSIKNATENLSIASSYDTTVGTSNIFIGSASGATVAEGSQDNVIIGRKAGEALTTGQKNTSVGENSLRACSTNSGNTSIGRKSGRNTTGGNNTFLGQEAGSEFGSGTYNICIGSLVGADILEETGTLNGSKNILIGDTTHSLSNSNVTIIAPEISSKIPQAIVADNSVFLGNTDITNTHLFGAGLTITNADGDITYKTTATSTKHIFMTNNTVEGLAIEDAKLKFQTEVRFAGNHEDVAGAGTPSTMTLAFIGSDLGIYTTANGWKKTATYDFNSPFLRLPWPVYADMTALNAAGTPQLADLALVAGVGFVGYNGTAWKKFVEGDI